MQSPENCDDCSLWHKGTKQIRRCLVVLSIDCSTEPATTPMNLGDASGLERVSLGML